MDNQQTQTLQPKTDYTATNPTNQTPQLATQSSSGDKSVANGENQSLLDKGISYLQESIIGKSDQAEEAGTTQREGDTSQHAAVDEAHPEKISEFLRDRNRSTATREGE